MSIAVFKIKIRLIFYIMSYNWGNFILVHIFKTILRIYSVAHFLSPLMNVSNVFFFTEFVNSVRCSFVNFMYLHGYFK